MVDNAQLARLVVSLEAKMDQYNKALAKADGDTKRTFSRMKASGQDFAKSFREIGTSIAAVFAGAQTLRGTARLLDAATQVRNALKVAGYEGENLTRVYDSLFESAQKNAAPISSLATLFSRISLAQKELGASTEEMLAFTDRISLALRVAGTDAQTASGSLLQLSQALGAGIVRAEEYNSILEGTPTIAQAVADGLDEAGGSVSKLRTLINDGKISSQAFFRAFEAGSVVLEEKVSGSETTVSQSLVRLQNVLQDAAGKFDQTTGASAGFAEAIDGLAGSIERLTENERLNWLLKRFDELGNQMFDGTIRELDAIGAAVEQVAQFFEGINAAAPTTEEQLAGIEQALINLKLNSAGMFGPEVTAAFADFIDQLLAGRGSAELAADAIAALGDADPNFARLETKIGGLVEQFISLRNAAIAAHLAAANSDDIGAAPSWAEFGKTFTPPKPVKPVKLSDYPILGGSGSGGRSKAVSEAQRQQKAVDDLIASLEHELAVVHESELQRRISNELRQVGVELTSEEGKRIAGLISMVERETKVREKASESMRATLETIGDVLGDVFSGATKDFDAFLANAMRGFAQLGSQNLNDLFNLENWASPQTGAALDGAWIGPDGYATILGDAVKSGAKDGSQSGIFGGLGQLFGGQGGSMLSAGLGGLGMGYQSANPLMGGLGGALSGFSAGGPIGAVIGGLGGEVGPLLKPRPSFEDERVAA